MALKDAIEEHFAMRRAHPVRDRHARNEGWYRPLPPVAALTARRAGVTVRAEGQKAA